MNLMEVIFLSVVLSFLIQLIFGSIAVINRSDKVTDLSYALTFIILAVINLFLPESLGDIAFLMNVLVIIWGIRLGSYLFIRINKIKRDKRFDGIREAPLKFISFWVLQAISVPIIMLPVTAATYSANDTAAWDIVTYLLIAAWVVGFAIETIADYQKYQFKNNPEKGAKWIKSGLWKYSRHPNYFGELTMWWAIFAIAFVQTGVTFLTVAGPLFITILILFVSGIPTLEKRYEKKYGSDPDYQRYKKEVRKLIPLPKFGFEK